MLKILIALSLFIAIQGQLIGGFTNRPDLIDAQSTKAIVKAAVQKLSAQQNMNVSPLGILSVETQLVNGLNYHIRFVARPYGTTDSVICTTRAYESFQGVQSVSSVQCA